MISNLQTRLSSAPDLHGKRVRTVQTFMDSTSKSYATGAWRDRIAAGFTNMESWSGDKLAAPINSPSSRHNIAMRWVSPGLPACNNRTHGPDQDLNRLASGSVLQQSQTPMFVSADAQATTIRNAYEQRGEFSAAVRQLFPGIDNAQARLCVRTIAGWQPLPKPSRGAASRYSRLTTLGLRLRWAIAGDDRS